MERENEKKTHSGIQYDGNEEIYQKKNKKKRIIIDQPIQIAVHAEHIEQT